jgi:methionyl-tRNA formyltransferase
MVSRSAEMRSVVCANSELGVVCLTTLLDLGAEVAAVFTHADDPSTRGWFRSVRELAEARGLPVFVDAPLGEASWRERLRALRPELLWSFYYRRLLPQAVLDIPARGALNLHGSLLPRYRGRCPTNWVLVHGERETGVTLHYMVARADAGDIVAQRPVAIAPDDTAITLYRKQAAAAAALLREVYPALRAGTAPRRPMDLAAGSYFGGRGPEDGRLEWRRPARQLYDLVRAVTHPYPGAIAQWRGEPLLVWWAQAEAAGGSAAPGTVCGVDQRGVAVQTGEGCLRLLRVQAAHDDERPAGDWARRAGVAEGTMLA